MKVVALALLALASLGIVSCSQQQVLDHMASKADVAFAKASIAELRHQDIEALRDNLDPALRSPAIDAKLRGLTRYFPPGEPRSVKLVGFHTRFSSSNGKRTSMVLEYQFDSGWVLGSIVLARDGDKPVIESLHVRRVTQSLEQANAFTLRGKSLLHWVMAALACLVPLFCVYAFVTCLRTPIKRRKWLWAIFTLLGVMNLSLDWTTGQLHFMPVSVLLFSASASTVLYGPWIISVAFPLGAVIFLFRRRELVRRADGQLPPELPPTVTKGEKRD